MAQLLVVQHTPSPGVHALVDAAVGGARDPAIEGVDVVLRPALAATASDTLEADGYLLITPANFGYMSGGLKHFFDTVYYPCLGSTRGRPYGVLVHGNEDTAGAVQSIERIVRGLEWRAVQSPLEILGDVGVGEQDRARELGSVLAATLMPE